MTRKYYEASIAIDDCNGGVIWTVLGNFTGQWLAEMAVRDWPDDVDYRIIEKELVIWESFADYEKAKNNLIKFGFMN